VIASRGRTRIDEIEDEQRAGEGGDVEAHQSLLALLL
jgi:hypothetical protein